jgi:hypothetical protein
MHFADMANAILTVKGESSNFSIPGMAEEYSLMTTLALPFCSSVDSGHHTVVPVYILIESNSFKENINRRNWYVRNN